MGINTSKPTSGDGDRWMITYASLLTAVLAFFILMVTMKNHDAKSTFQVADNLTRDIFEKIVVQKTVHKLDWLDVENTGTLGVRLVIPSIVENQSMFRSNSSKITDNFIPYIHSLSTIIKDLELDSLIQWNKVISKKLKKQNKILSLEILIQGHTDALPVQSGEFTSNWDLSTARSYSFMKLLQENTGLNPKIFSIAGYGPFLPKTSIDNYSENRRVELFIKFQLESSLIYAEI
ncbi:MAG: flagellar motor protein MotB [Fidelibacterota bacterium]